jgi:hypothetical protein
MPKRTQAVVIARLTVELVRTSILEFGKAGMRLTAGEALLGAAIFMAQVQGRPMTAAKAAAYVGLPRPTAVRRLEDMRARGILEVQGGLWRASPASPALTETIARVIEVKTVLIKKAAAELSKMDSRTVANTDGKVSR